MSDSWVVGISGTGDPRVRFIFLQCLPSMLKGILLVATIPIAMMRHSATSGLCSTCTCNTALSRTNGHVQASLTTTSRPGNMPNQELSGASKVSEIEIFIKQYALFRATMVPIVSFQVWHVPDIDMRALLKTGATYWKDICLQHPLNAIGWCIHNKT